VLVVQGADDGDETPAATTGLDRAKGDGAGEHVAAPDRSEEA
jgi:hypothetical protein